MNYNLREVALAGDLIHTILLRLEKMDVLEIDWEKVDLNLSALHALEKDFLNENLVEDDLQTPEGLNKKALRYALSAVYFDGSPVISDEPLFMGSIGNQGDSFAFWDDDVPTDNADYGKKQVVHSDLMITSIDQIRLHTQFLEYRHGKPCRRLLIDGLDGVLITVTDLVIWKPDVLSARDYGILPLSRGRWNVTNWLEPIETMAASE